MHWLLKTCIIRRQIPEAVVKAKKLCDNRKTFCSFDIFQKLKDPPDNNEETKKCKRKPTDKVIRLVDEVMNLTLIEAADLCDLCQEKLSERMNGGYPIPGRTPFPHPSNMFGGGAISISPYGSYDAFQKNNSVTQTVSSSPSSTLSPPASEISNNSTSTEKQTPKEEEKSTFTVLLKSYETAKKVITVKEVRAILQLGLKEAKEFVEAAPKVIRKSIPKEEAEEIKKKLEAVGACVELQ